VHGESRVRIGSLNGRSISGEGRVMGDMVPITTVTFVASVLVLAAAGHFVLRYWARRRAGDEEAREAALSPAERSTHWWFTHALQEMVPPLALLVWVHGAYLAINVGLRHVLALGPASTPLSALKVGYGVCIVAAIVWMLSRVGRLLESFLNARARGSENTWDELLTPLAGKAVRRALPLLALILGVPALTVTPAVGEVLRNGTSLLLIAVVAFVIFEVVNTAAAFVLSRHRLDVTDNLQARSIYTQVVVLKKVAFSIIGIFTLASMLMVFESVRQFGASILASAGIAGIVVGFAAQRSIATLLAGFQIALTQPIRLDDVVIVEKEWGRIEEITLTYVVVRVWDLRRLVVPISYFIEQPFQSWTRTSADILGTVFLYVDYTVPVDSLRAELTRILRASPFWDGKVNVLQVTDAKEHTLEVRALASAADASLAWDLRCEIREQLVVFLQRNYPESLPKLRASFEPVRASLVEQSSHNTVATLS
jgi:small-conductance mechanosensitive channel